MTKFDELKQRYPNVIPVQELRQNVSIMELAAQFGYQLLAQKGRMRPVLHNPTHDDVIIIKNPQDAGQQLYQRAGDFSDAGTIVDFIRNRLGTVFSSFNRPGQHEFRSITSVLYEYLRIDPQKVAHNRQSIAIGSTPADPSARQPFAKDQFDIRPLENDNYLGKRHIAARITGGAEFAGRIVTQVAYLNPQTGHLDDFLTAKANPDRKHLTFKNVAFPYYNGVSEEVMGFELRNERIKMHAPGSDRFSSVFISNVPPKTERFFVTESSLDALAHRQLRSIHGDEAFNTVYFSTGGQITPEQINTIFRYVGTFEKSDSWKITLAFDNDPKGHRYDLQFVQQLAAPQLPLTPTVAGLGRVGYLLPEGDNYRPAREALLGLVESYNTDVRAQIQAIDGDELSQRELSGQLITIARNQQQIAVHLPEVSSALAAFTRGVLEQSGLGQRVSIEKACNKDFAEDLKRHIDGCKKFKYLLTDEIGNPLYNGKSASKIVRILNQLSQQAASEGMSKMYKVMLRQPDGWLRSQAEVTIRDGQIVTALQQSEFKKKVLEEKGERSSQAAERRKLKN